jgi:hypothetical protein
VDVLATEAPLLDGFVDDIACGDGAAGYVQPVAFRRRPLEAFAVALKGNVASGEIGFSELGEPGQKAALRLGLVDRALDDHENGNGADGGGEAGADQPPKAPDLATLGVVGLVEILEGARRAAAIELRQPILPLGSGEGAKASMLRVAAAIDHEP